MSDRVREFQEKLFKNLHGGDQIVAALSYFPLIGWIYPYYFKSDDPLCRFHGRQALLLNVLIGIIYFAVWFLEHFPLTAWLFGERAFFNPITRSIWIVSLFLFLGLSIVASFKAYIEQIWEVPYLEKIYVAARNRILEGLKKATRGEDR